MASSGLTERKNPRPRPAVREVQDPVGDHEGHIGPCEHNYTHAVPVPPAAPGATDEEAEDGLRGSADRASLASGGSAARRAPAVQARPGRPAPTGSMSTARCRGVTWVKRYGVVPVAGVERAARTRRLLTPATETSDGLVRPMQHWTRPADQSLASVAALRRPTTERHGVEHPCYSDPHRKHPPMSVVLASIRP